MQLHDHFSISNHMAVRVIWDISPEFFLSILKSSRASARVILKLIQNNKGDISKSHEQSCDSSLITFSVKINTNNHLHDVKSEDDYKTEGDYKI